MSATNPMRIRDLVHLYGWDAMVRLTALGIQNLADAQVLFVNSGATNATDADDGVHGLTLENPLATIDYAIGLCTASEQSIILVAPGHAETKAASGALNTCDVAGVKIIGLGVGALRPTITLATDTAAVAFTVTAANVAIANIKTLVTKDAVVKAINVAADSCSLFDMEVADNADTTEAAIGILTTAAATNLHVKGYKHSGFLTGDACTRGIALEGVNTALIEDCWFRGAFSTSAVDMLSAACAGVVVKNSIFENGTTALSKDVTDHATSKWSAVNCWDVVGGYSFAGGSGTAVASYAPASASSALIDTVAVSATPAANSLGTFIYSGGTSRGQPLPASTSLVDIIGDYTGPHGGAAADDNVKAHLDLIKAETDVISGAAVAAAPTSNSLANFIYSGGTSRGTVLADSKSLVDALGANGSSSVLDACRVTCVAKSVTDVHTGTVPLFTVTGAVKVLDIVGYITTAVEAKETLVKLTATATGGGSVDLCTALDLTGAAQYALLTITGTFANAMAKSATLGTKAASQAAAFITTAGVINQISADTTSTGAITWYVTYQPLATGSKLTPA